MVKLVVGLALVSAGVAPGTASDFSKLAEPSFARSLLVSPVRQRQTECAGVALYRAELGQSPGKENARRLAEAVAKRLAIEVDDTAIGRALVDSKHASYADPTKSNQFWNEVRSEMALKCEPLFEASRKGDPELQAALGPMPTEPLTLPSEEQCLATSDYADETGLVDWDAEFGKLLRKERFGNVDPRERARRQALVDGGIKELRAKKPDKDHLELMMVACLHTVAEAAKRLGPDISDQLER